MTVPKFRVWDTVKKAMSEVQAVVYTEKKVYPIYFKKVRRYVPLSEAVLMQSTGLEDKNGTEIFEGDVFYDEEVDEIGKVYYKDGCFFGKTDFFDTLLYKIASDIKIIGNIHDNPDLMEVIHEQETT